MKKINNKGFTLIEMLLVMGIMGIVAVLGLEKMKRDADLQQAEILAKSMRDQLVPAVNQYITSQYSFMVNGNTATNNMNTSPGGGGTAITDPAGRTCAGQTCTLTTAALVSLGYLPNGWVNTDPYGNAYNIVLRRNPGGVAIGNAGQNEIQAMITSGQVNTGGVARPDLAGYASKIIGPDAGFISPLGVNMVGLNGAWTETNARFSNITTSLTGQVGVRAGSGTSSFDIYLRRDGTLPMTGNLNMTDTAGAHDIINGKSVLNDATGGANTSSALNTVTDNTSKINIGKNLVVGDINATATNPTGNLYAYQARLNDAVVTTRSATTPISSMLPRYVSVGAGLVINGSVFSIPAAACTTGVGKIIVVPKNIYYDPTFTITPTLNVTWAGPNAPSTIDLTLNYSYQRMQQTYSASVLSSLSWVINAPPNAEAIAEGFCYVP